MPELGALVARFPAVTGFAQAEDPLLGPRTFLVSAGATDGNVELSLIQSGPQRHRLHNPGELLGAVAERCHVRVARLLVGGQAQIQVEFLGGAVAQFVHLAELPAGVDVHDREGDRAGMEGLARQVQQDRGVLTDAVEQNGALEGGGRLPEDPNGFGLQGVEHPGGLVVNRHVADLVLRRRAQTAGCGLRGRPPTHCCMHDSQAVSLATASSSIT